MRGRWCAPSPLRFWTSRSLLPASRAGWGSSCRGRTERGEVLHTSAALTTIERPKRDLRFGVGHESNRWTALKAERRANLKSTAATNAAAPPTSRRPLRAFTCQRQGRDLGRDWDWCRRGLRGGEGREGGGRRKSRQSITAFTIKGQPSRCSDRPTAPRPASYTSYIIEGEGETEITEVRESAIGVTV